MPNVTPLGLPNRGRLKRPTCCTSLAGRSRSSRPSCGPAADRSSRCIRRRRVAAVPRSSERRRRRREPGCSGPRPPGPSQSTPAGMPSRRRRCRAEVVPAAGWPCAGRSSSISSVVRSSSLPSISDTPRCQIALSGQSVRSQETLISGIWPPGGSTAGCGLVRSATVTMADSDNAQFCRRRSAYTVTTRDADR